MITNNVIDDTPGVTMYRHPPERVLFDEHFQPTDRAYNGPATLPVLIDWDLLEEMLLDGKFETKIEVTSYCKAVYTLLHDPDDEATHWNRSAWRRIKEGLMPEAVAAYNDLPQQVYKGRVASNSDAAQSLLKKGKCRNGHKIKGVEDLGSNGKGPDGRIRMGCLHCRRLRSKRARSNNKKAGS